LGEAPLPAPPATPECPAREAQLVPLSAVTGSALRELAGRFARHLEERPDESLADVAFTAGAGRSHFGCRLAAAADSPAALRDQLAAFSRGEPAVGLHAETLPARGRPKVAFIFPGQGCQYPGMGRALYAGEPAFRAALDRCRE